jgi:hypothetical protein
MHITARTTLTAFAAALSLAALPACYPDNAHKLGHNLTVHGVVTDLGTGQPLAGVKVTLLSNDNYAPLTTGANGYFQFDDVLQVDNLLVQYQLAGYLTFTLTVNPTLLADGGFSLDGGSFAGFNSADGFDASTALSQVLLQPVSGVVYAGATLAGGAQLALTTLTGTPVYQTTAGTDGAFTFPAVRSGSYLLVVMPWDRDGDMLADTQYFSQGLSVTPNTSSELTHLAINLGDVQKTVVAGSFVSLNHPYPITIAQLQAGVSGILQATGGSIFLTFGAEVDPSLTSFQLVQYEAGGTRFSQPIPLSVTWSHGVTVQLTPGTSLQASDATNVGYQLRIVSLRFADGTAGITAAPNTYGTINFSVQSLPIALANPTPALYLGNQLTATQAATKAVFDANTVWLLDAKNDFVFDTIPNANWSAANPMQLQWPGVPGAVAYHLYMRNTTSPGNSGVGTLDWIEQPNVVIQATDPNQTGTIVATFVSPWSLGLGSSPGVGPWAFGNHIQFAVATQDALGFIAPIDSSKLLDTADTFGGLLNSATFDPASTFPFAATTELGDTFTKTLRLTFSEPMLTANTPTVTSSNARVTVKKVLASAFANGGNPGAALTSATTAFLSLQLGEPGTCTELTVARTATDSIIVLRDASYFAQGATSSVVFLSAAGQFVLEADGISAVDAATNTITLATPLIAGVNLAQGSYACALSGTSTTTVASVSGTTLTVASANLFAVGDAVLFYEPQGAGPPVADFGKVMGVDTAAKTVVLQTAPSTGHTPASLLLPLPPFGAEFVLRNSQSLALLHDVVGSATAQLIFGGPLAGIAVGDKLLIDADGDLKTTADQVQVPVAQVAFAPTGTPAVYSLTVALPATMTLLHNKSKVIFLGDTFQIAGTKDTSGNGPLDPHRDQLTPDGLLY